MTETATETSTATSPVCPSEPIYIAALQDSWIDETKKDQNNGASSLLIVQPTGNFDRRTLIQFDLNSLPNDCEIISATLIINQITSATQVIDLFRLTQPWDEMTVTWNNAPGYDINIQGSFDGNVLTPSQRLIDITNLVNIWYNNSLSNFGMLLRSATGNGTIELESRESSNPPLLQVEVENP